MIYHLNKLVKGLFDRRNKSSWTYNEFSLVPPSTAKDNSKTWQLLTHQCYSASTLAECGLSSRLTPSLQRLFEGLCQAAKNCNPNVLIYFWDICTSLNRIRMSGEPKHQCYPLLRLLLAALLKSVSASRNQWTPSMVGFLGSLNSILTKHSETKLQNPMREILKRVYQKVIKTMGDVVGHNHAIVLNMVSHYAKYYNAHIYVDKTGPESILERYKHLIEVAKKAGGFSKEQEITLLYGYIRATSLYEIDYGVVLELQEQTAKICKAQKPLKCCLATRAFAFSTDLLANMHFEEEIAETKTLRKQQMREEKKAIWNRALVEKQALAEQKSPLQAKEIANNTALAVKRALPKEKKECRKGPMERKLGYQGPPLPPKKSQTYLNNAISVLQKGDQDCLTWAASFSKRLSLWHKDSGDRLAWNIEKDRTAAIRLEIEATPSVKFISRRSKEVCKVRGGPGYVNGSRIHRREAHRAVVSTLEGSHIEGRYHSTT